jgi:hypothetical protein
MLEVHASVSDVTTLEDTKQQTKVKVFWNVTPRIFAVYSASITHLGLTLVCAQYGYPKGSPNTNS